MKYTYWPQSQKVKPFRQWNNLVIWKFLKNHTGNVVKKLYPDPGKYLEFYTVCFYWLPRGALSRYIKTKLQNTCFSLIASFKKNKTNKLEHWIFGFTAPAALGWLNIGVHPATHRTNSYCGFFHDSSTQLHSCHCLIDWLHSFCQAVDVSMWKRLIWCLILWKKVSFLN